MTQRVAILGIGNLRYGLPVIGAIANFFGERLLEIACYDADAERLELFERFARATFMFHGTPHIVTASLDATEVLAEASRVILCLDLHCAKRVLRQSEANDQSIEAASKLLLETYIGQGDLLVVSATHLRLQKGFYYRVTAPPELTEAESLALPHQMLRWMRGDDMLYTFIAEHERSPIRLWLENPESAELVPDA